MSDSSDQLAVSVVIPSRDRPQLLARCLAAVLAALDLLDRPAEVIVVDDGNGSAAEGIPDDPRIRVLLSDGQGPSRARNRGVLLATAPIIVFTDDDATVEPAWLIDAMASFDARPEIMGVKGPVFAPPTDALYEHSIDQVDQGVFITCNIAYRRVALMAVGGLDPSWRLPAHGDRDLGYRISALGEVVYVATMVAHHPVRPFGVREWARRGRFVENDWLLYRRYPEQKPNGMPLRIAPLYGIAARWWQLLIRPEHRVRNPRRFWRWLRLALAQTCVGAWATLTRWRHRPRDPSARPGFAPQGLRIAYLGPTPQRHAGGPPDIAAMILESLVARGHVVDCFVSIGEHDQAAKHLDELVGINIRAIKNPFLFGRWYSKTHLSKMLSGQVLGMLTRRRVGAMLLDEHARTPYDVLYQFSNLELFGISPRNRKQLPPIASHPSVHAAGELRWMRAEAALARACEGRWRPMVIRASLRLRALRQKRDIADVSLLMAISTRFGELIAQDYGFNKANIVTVPNAIDPERFAPLATSASEQPSREFAVLGRIAVRKGIEDLVPLAAQLQAQGSAAQLSVVGSRSLWSNYEPLIAQQQSAQLTWRNAVSRDEIAAWLPSVAALLQPARYEPFGLTVAEAMLCGLPIIATAEVGAIEAIDPRCVSVVPPASPEAMADAMEEILGRSSAQRAQIGALCRAEAIRLFNPAHITDLVEEALLGLALKQEAGR